MFQAQSWQRRSWGVISSVGAVVLGILVALITGHIATLLVALVVAGIATALWAQPHAARREHSDATRTAALEPVRQRVVAAADGTVYAAIALDLPADEGYSTVLTSTGYALINNAGQIVYRFKR